MCLLYSVKKVTHLSMTTFSMLAQLFADNNTAYKILHCHRNTIPTFHVSDCLLLSEALNLYSNW